MTNENVIPKSLTVVVPCFNEREGIEATIEQIQNGLAENHAGLEFVIILVDDGSEDETGDLINEMAENCSWLKAIRLGQRKGRGAAICAGR